MRVGVVVLSAHPGAVDPSSTSTWTWLSWLNGTVAIILSSIVIGVVQIVVIVLYCFRNVQQYGSCCVRPALLKSVFDILQLLLFQWTVLNATSLIVSLSFFGLPNLQYSPLWAFVFCLVSALIQYAIFVRKYVGKRGFVYWRLRDCFFVVFPMSAVVLGAGVVFLINFLNYPVQDLIRNYLIACLLVGFFFFGGVPFILYTCVLIPYQRRMRKKQVCLFTRCSCEHILNFTFLSINRESQRPSLKRRFAKNLRNNR